MQMQELKFFLPASGYYIKVKMLKHLGIISRAMTISNKNFLI
jgi:hypothetical protein